MLDNKWMSCVVYKRLIKNILSYFYHKKMIKKQMQHFSHQQMINCVMSDNQ
uniref:Uncharacterized protein n=1 Tax=Papilio xuthus TaxID=66420 RepID=I4DLP2_PAPXU|nr:unknown unsecreted protein [Papilio xuthus]